MNSLLWVHVNLWILWNWRYEMNLFNFLIPFHTLWSISRASLFSFRSMRIMQRRQVATGMVMAYFGVQTLNFKLWIGSHVLHLWCSLMFSYALLCSLILFYALLCSSPHDVLLAKLVRAFCKLVLWMLVRRFAISTDLANLFLPLVLFLSGDRKSGIYPNL